MGTIEKPKIISKLGDNNIYQKTDSRTLRQNVRRSRSSTIDADVDRAVEIALTIKLLNTENRETVGIRNPYIAEEGTGKGTQHVPGTGRNDSWNSRVQLARPQHLSAITTQAIADE